MARFRLLFEVGDRLYRARGIIPAITVGTPATTVQNGAAGAVGKRAKMCFFPFIELLLCLAGVAGVAAGVTVAVTAGRPTRGATATNTPKTTDAATTPTDPGYFRT